MSKKEKIIKSFDLIKETWQVYQKNLLKFIEVFVYGLVGLIPLLTVLLLFFVYNITGLADSASFSTNLILGILAFAGLVYGIYLALVYSIRTKVASILLIKNDFTSAKENFKEAKPYFIRFLGVSLLLVVLVIAWGFVFIIPALIFAIYYGFAQYVLVIEDKRPFTSVERSYDLVRGYFWPVLGRLALISVIAIFIYWIMMLPMTHLESNEWLSFGYSMFMNLIWAVISPYFVIYSYNIYKSLKKTNK